MISKDSLVQIQADDPRNDNSNDQDFGNTSTMTLRADADIVKGRCQWFISKKQKSVRQPNYFEIPNQQHKNWQPMACHFRNIEYTSQNVRTPKALQECFEFICKEYLPFYIQIFKDQTQRKKFQLFLYDRVRSIRCQMFVQAIFDTKISMKIIKLILFLETMIEMPVQLAGLEYFFDPKVKQKLLANQATKQCFYEALQLAIYWQKKQKLVCLLDRHFDQIQKQQTLQQALEKKIKILSKNYIVYFNELAKNKSIFVRLILWSYIKKMRQIFISHYKKARMNERASFICRVMGYSKLDGWIDLSKQADVAKLESHKIQYDLDINLWIPDKSLFDALEQISCNIK